MNTATANHLLLRTTASGKPDCAVQWQIIPSFEDVQGCSGQEDLYLTLLCTHGWRLREFFNV